MADNATGGAAAGGTGNVGSGATRIGPAASGAGSGSGTAGATGSTGAGSGAGSGGSSGSGSGNAGGGGQASGATGAASGDHGAAGGGGAGSAAGATGNSSAGENWGGNWREGYANGDQAKLNVLQRYDSPRAALDALFSAQGKIRSGELKAVLPKDATPEQLTQFRKDNGLPEKADGYFEKLPQGLALDDHDKTVLKPYTELMHKHNLSPEAAHEFLQARAQMLDSLIETQLANDKVMAQSTEDALRKEWGNEYRANVNNIEALLAGAPEEVRLAMYQARTPEGSLLFNDPATKQYFAQLARQMNPFGVIVGSDGGSMDQKGVEARIAEIEGPKLMGNRNSEYWKGPTADRMQKEYRDLIDARERMKGRQRAA